MLDESKIPHKILCYYFENGAEGHFESVFYRALRLFDSVRLKPNWMATNFDNSEKFISFKRSYKRLLTQGFPGLEFFTLLSIPDHLGYDFFKGFNLAVGYMNYPFCTNNPPFNNLNISIRDHLLNEESFDLVCHDLAKLSHPIYGFRDRIGYAGAMESLCNIAFLGDHYYEGGFIHKLYAWNLLNNYHLNRRIDEETFADWVAADPRRGELEPYAPGSFLWKIPQERISEVSKPLADADILFDEYKHFYPWVWTFAGRVNRGDLTRQDVIRLVLEHVRKHGRVPTPPDRWQESSPDGLFITDEPAVTRWLKEWGHPAASLPDFPQPASVTPKEAVGQILGSLGFTSPEQAQIFQPGEQGLRELSEAEVADLLPKQKPRKPKR